MKKYLFAIGLATSTLPTLAQEIKVPMFFDVHVEITDSGKKIFSADALLPRNKEVRGGGISKLAMPYTCPPDSTFAVPPVYEEGVTVNLVAWGSPSLAGIQMEYAVATSDKTKEEKWGKCSVQMVDTHKQSAGNSFRMRPGETERVGGEPIAVAVTLRGMYAEAPADRVIGRFLPSK